ncbi:MAG: MBL fold metallo-hydrolase [Leptolinea sp.]|jgi:glyoxylase-like metal-dependent hydrolase (beta-lactamase superfamily II)|nr:MBL fold metallo-hydrolase [Leptolinea sp.]
MEEIAHNVFIETGFIGVTVAAIPFSQGQILIDAPFRNDDIRSWRASLVNLAAGGERVLINLDAHYDRTLGARAMEATLIAHEATAIAFRSRPLTFKNQHLGTGAAWEQSNNLGTVRWIPPDITFDHSISLHPDSLSLVMEHHPGPMAGSCWVEIPETKVMFVGDTLPVDQPPFLANADIPAWITSLELLKSSAYSGYTLVSGRGGVTTQAKIPALIKWLTGVETKIREMGEKSAAPEDTASLVNGLLDKFTFPPEHKNQYVDRLQWGLFQYYAHRFTPGRAETEE